MPNLWWLSRQDAPEMGDASLAALLAGAEPAEGLAPGLQPLADALAALTARPASDELAGEAAALAEFENRVGVPVPVSRSRHRRHPLLTSLLSARAAAAAAVAALGLGGFATAAFAGALPAPAQQFAHHTFGAPAAGGGSPPAHIPARPPRQLARMPPARRRSGCAPPGRTPKHTAPPASRRWPSATWRPPPVAPAT